MCVEEEKFDLEPGDWRRLPCTMSTDLLANWA